MVTQVLTANRLIDGDVVYWRTGTWVEALGDAEVLADEALAETALEKAKTFVARNVVVNPYLFEMKGGRPAKEREIIRALGPSVREDVGKQASGLAISPPARLRRPAPPQAGGESDDDVSI